MPFALSATASSAFAANPSPSAYDRIQDSAINGLQKQDRDQELRIDGLVEVAKSHQNQIDMNREMINADRADQAKVNNALVSTNLRQDALIETNGKKAQAAIDGVTHNANQIIEVNNVNRVQDSRLDSLENAPKPKDGVNGLDGKDGKDGVNGLDGAKGDTGAAGKDGTSILNGKDGANGKDADMTVVNNLASGVTQLKSDGAYAQSRIDAANANIQANREAAAATNKRVAENTAAIADHEGRIQSLESSTSSKFAQLNDKIEQNRQHASAGIAGVAAMANIPQVSQNATFSVGAGTGSYDGEQGLAVGFSGRINGTIVTKASVSATTQNDFVFGLVSQKNGKLVCSK